MTKLVKKVGCFPLAIEQAGAYMAVRLQSLIETNAESCGTILEHYLKLYEENAKKLLEFKPRRSVWKYRNDTVFTTWEVSFNAIRHESTYAADLLLLCGFLNSDDIFEEMLLFGDTVTGR